MVSDVLSRRVPWVALALSLLSAGVGHLYCGRIAKGLPLYFAWLLVPICITMAALLPPSPTLFTLLVLLPVAVVGIVDGDGERPGGQWCHGDVAEADHRLVGHQQD